MERKIYRLSDEHIEIINSVKEEKGFKTDTAALRYIISYYKDQDKLLDKFDAKYKDYMTNLRLSAAASQKYTFMILDILNTLIYETKATDRFPAAGATMHKIARESEEAYQKIIEANKQKKDNKNRKENSNG